MLHIAVCADNFLLKIIKTYFDSLCLECKLDQYESSIQLVNLGSVIKQYDAVFLDIDTEEKNGIEVAKKIRDYSSQFFLVLETAFVQGLLDGYKIGANRCILKNYILFIDSVKESLEEIVKKSNIVIKCHFLEGEKKIYKQDVIYIESNLHKLSFVVQENGNERIYTLYGKLDVMENDLASQGFLRIHQSYLVNKSYVDDFERYSLLLSSGQKLPVSKRRFLDVRSQLIEWKEK